jgi:hypothetical protein
MQKTKKIFTIAVLIMLFSGCDQTNSDHKLKQNDNAPKVENSNGSEKKKDSGKKKETDTEKSKVNSGLMLGLRSQEKTDNEKVQHNYRTVWVVPEGEDISIYELGNFIVVPNGNDFWQIEKQVYKKESNLDYDANANESDTLVSHKVGSAIKPKKRLFYSWEKNQVEGLDDEGKYNGTYDYVIGNFGCKLNFVSNKFASCSYDQSVFSGGAHGTSEEGKNFVSEIANINNVLSFNLAPFDDQYHSKILKRLGKDQQRMIENTRKSIMNNPEVAKFADETDKNTDTIHWGIERENGAFVGKLYVEMHTSGSNYTYRGEKLPVELPESVVGYDTLTPDWKTIKKKLPDTLDAVTSIKKDMLVAIDGEKLEVFSMDQNEIGDSLSTCELSEDETIIMAQWATDEYVDEWNSYFEENFSDTIKKIDP